MKYRKKPIVIEAMQFKGLPFSTEFLRWMNDHGLFYDVGVGGSLIIPTLEGEMTAAADDWIIQGIQGEFYPCKPDIFEATYEEVTE